MSINLLVFTLSAAAFTFFWVWAVVHALQTPRASRVQRAVWITAMVVNPVTIMWYWYTWKRWAFLALFTPFLLTAMSMPLFVRHLLTSAEQTTLTNALFALGSARLVILAAAVTVFPLILRLAALIHLGKNTELTAMDRNDWIVSLALPVFGYGAGLAYCARFQRAWAILGFVWWVIVVVIVRAVTINVGSVLIPAGEEKREEFRHSSSSSRSPMMISTSSSSASLIVMPRPASSSSSLTS